MAGRAPVEGVGGGGFALDVDHLSVSYVAHGRPVLDRVTLSIGEGERVGIVGESGSGKTTLALAMTELLPSAARIVGGSVRVNGRDYATLSSREARALRGGVIGRVPQDSLSGLNPVITIGHQLRDALRAHRRPDKAAERQQVIEALRAVGLPDVEAKLGSYPHELSGGMRQRVLIAMALINGPRLLVADEPTTALDATVQAQVLAILNTATQARGMALVLVSHDMNVVASVCDRVVVMYRGEVVEEGPLDVVLNRPKHPYTVALMAAGRGIRRSVNVDTEQVRELRETAMMHGCQYSVQCERVFEACTSRPDLHEEDGERHAVRCFATRGSLAGATAEGVPT